MSVSYHETDDWREAFAAGFCDGAPAEFDCDADAETVNPWQEPWTWETNISNYATSIDGYEAGRRFADENREALLAEVEYEAEYLAEQAELEAAFED